MAGRGIVGIGRLRLTVAPIVVLAAAGCSLPDKVERRGNFHIEYFQSDAFGHMSSRRAISHGNGSKTTSVTDAAVSFLISPFDPDRIIYDTCEGDSGCSHMYFDGHTGKHHVIGRGLKISMSALDDGSRWSG